MKKLRALLILPFLLLPVLTACGQFDYTEYIAEIKSDIFCAETDEFSLTLSCIERERPYLADGIPYKRSKTVEISLRDKQNASEYTVSVVGTNVGGETAFRHVKEDYFFSQGVEEFPTQSVSLRVVWENGEKQIAATSVKNQNTLSPQAALNCAVKAERELVSSLTKNGVFLGEFYVRLLRREQTYYYVGIIDQNGNTLSLLLDSTNGTVLARRERNH